MESSQFAGDFRHSANGFERNDAYVMPGTLFVMCPVYQAQNRNLSRARM